MDYQPITFKVIPEDMKDDLSRKEALISGFCQECQDKTFKPESTETTDSDSREKKQ